MRYVLDGQETERLKFRLLNQNDFDTWLELFRKPGVSRFLGFDETTEPRQQCEIWFEKTFGRYENDQGGQNVLVDKQTGAMIGQSGLLVQEVDGIWELEVAYSILPGFWKMGYATEAAKKCRDVAFLNDYSESLISIIHLDNMGSKHVAQKNGMDMEKQTTFLDMPVEVYRVWKNKNASY